MMCNGEVRYINLNQLSMLATSSAFSAGNECYANEYLRAMSWTYELDLERFIDDDFGSYSQSSGVLQL